MGALFLLLGPLVLQTPCLQVGLGVLLSVQLVLGPKGGVLLSRGGLPSGHSTLLPHYLSHRRKCLSPCF